MNFENDEQLERLHERFARMAQAKHDYHNEIGGRDVGRIARFTSAQGRDGEELREKRSRQDAQLTRLQMLMADPAYAALYKETLADLGKAETATEAALEKARLRVEDANTALEDLQRRAAVTEDGQRVYRDEQGRARTESDAQLSSEEAEAIDWPTGAPSFEDFQRQVSEAESAQQAHDAILGYQVDVLGRARDRMTDPDDPPDSEELESIQRDIEEQMPPEVSAEIKAMKVETPAFSPNSAPDVPKL